MTKNTPPPMRCAEARVALSDRLDGQIEPPALDRLTTHLAGCPACQFYARDMAFLHQTLPEQLDDTREETAIWDRLQSSLEAEVGLQQVEEPPRRQFLKLGLAASLLITTGVGGTYLLRRPNADVVAETVNDYLTFRASGKTLHITAEHPSAVKTWLEERIDFNLPAGVGPGSDYRLIGGRLCSFLERRLAALHFTAETRLVRPDISLYVMSAEGIDLPRPTEEEEGRRAYRATRQKGVSSVAWIETDLLYVVVSTGGEDHLRSFANAVTL